MDPPEDTAKSISKAGGASEKNIFKKGQKMLDRQRRREQKRLRNHSANTKVREEEREGGGSPGTGADIPLEPVERTKVERIFHCSP